MEIKEKQKEAILLPDGLFVKILKELFPDSEFFNDSTVSFDIVGNQVIE